MDTAPQAPQNSGNNTNSSIPKQPIESDEIDLKDLFIKIWAQRKLILIVTGIAIVIGLLVLRRQLFWVITRRCRWREPGLSMQSWLPW